LVLLELFHDLLFCWLELWTFIDFEHNFQSLWFKRNSIHCWTTNSGLTLANIIMFSSRLKKGYHCWIGKSFTPIYPWVNCQPNRFNIYLVQCFFLSIPYLNLFFPLLG
jgi:hypothetical protein